MARKRLKQQECPNCGHSLVSDDNFCPRCGQENHTHKLPVRHFLVELLSGLFNFDTKLLRTLRALFWPPGLVIREFNANKRVCYVHPLRLYLFTSVLFFIFLGWSTHDRSETGMSMEINGSDSSETSGLTLHMENGTITDSTILALSARRHLTNAILDSALTPSGETPGILTRAILRMAVGMSMNSLRKDEFVQGLLSGFSKLLFVLVPFFALLMKVVYLRKGKYYSEHLVFALYFHTVLFLILGIAAFIGLLFELPSIWYLALLLPLIYLFFAIRTAYGDRWWMALFRTVLISLGYSLMLLVAFVAAAVIGALSI